MFPSPCILRPRWRGSRWNWVLALRVKKTRVTGLPGRQRSFTISSAVWPTWRTDGQTDGHWATAKTALMHSVARWIWCAYSTFLVHSYIFGIGSVPRRLRLHGVGLSSHWPSVLSALCQLAFCLWPYVRWPLGFCHFGLFGAPSTLDYNFVKCWPVFNFFTNILSDDCVSMPSRLKTVPCETCVQKFIQLAC